MASVLAPHFQIYIHRMSLEPFARSILPFLVGIHGLIWFILLSNLAYLRRTRQQVAVDPLPPLSILVPARNEEANLERLLPSILTQDYPEFELVVVDDGSTDGTWRVLSTIDDERLKAIHGEGPPHGWLGKPHACHLAASRADGDLLLFLDADTELADDSVLRRLVQRKAALPDDTVATGLPRLKGAAQLLVSLVPSAILTGLPWPLVRHVRTASLGALNGQFWMVDAELYRRLEPHREVKDDVLEDVEIGRYFKREGYTPALLDVRDEVNVFMYSSFGDAWRGFRKNAYLILGGTPVAFVGLSLFFFLTFVASPLVHPGFLASVILLKAITDRLMGVSPLYSLAAPLSYLLASALQLDSAIHHWTGHVSWKGRAVSVPHES